MKKKEITPEMRYIAGVIFSCTRGDNQDIEKIFNTSEQGQKLKNQAIEIAERQHLINTLTLNGKNKISAAEYLSAVRERLSSMKASGEIDSYNKLNSAMENNASIKPALQKEIQDDQSKLIEFKRQLKNSVPEKWQGYFDLNSHVSTTKDDPKTKAIIALRTSLIDVRNEISKGDISYDDGIKKLKEPIEKVIKASIAKSIFKSDTSKGLKKFMESHYPESSQSLQKKSEKK